ncbi:TonB-dependent receptor [Pseudoalteromonas luteoviolacea]|uniref:TonB-dependent receptor plug domain-containing protein n=1 Tax=Pseudoalteromonas luteoviolacea TaxID=43657 RepID=UPI001B36A173|nr:TonB-dependent receptor [Pseudoalteromonas luteoviolacea]MBQ4811536.1 TonB-dependent receptor [Pseudoalteromonas luteoviolacea]
MWMNKAQKCLWLCSAVTLFLTFPNIAKATNDIETITVTGSRIKRSVQADSSSPVSNVDAKTLSDMGANGTRDLIEALPFNAGAQNNSDNLSQNYTVGTANVNLRGLGVSSTLVLLNGRRQVTSSVVTDQGASFVDTASLIPLLAIKRVEILRDGASAIYGSDAVAGVVNFISRDDLDGAQLQYEYRQRVSEGSQDETKVDFAYGADIGESGYILFAASVLERASLLLGEVDWHKPAFSSFGNPGSFVIPSLASAQNPQGLTVADRNCEKSGGQFSLGSNGNSFCLFDFAPQITIVPNEDRLQFFATAKWDWSDRIRLWFEAGHADNQISREVSPSFPVLNAPSVLSSHPDNTFSEDVFFRGRPYGAGKPTEQNYYEHRTTRVAFGLEGDIGQDMFWQLAYVNATNDALLNPRDVIADNFQQALHGFGGTNCDKVESAGIGSCIYFNPFDPFDPDNERLRSFIIGDYIGNLESKLQILEGYVSFDEVLGFGDEFIALAIGAQIRKESIVQRYDALTQQDRFAFLIGNQNVDGSRDVTAIFAEARIPIWSNFELGLAARYEDYGSLGGDTTDPKVSVLWHIADNLSLRGSYSTSFRAPSVHQLKGVQTNFANITDPADGSTTFGGNRTLGDDGLVSETSTAVNIGASFSDESVNLDVDYWRFSFDDVLTRESHQAVVNAAPDDPNRVIRTAAGTISIVNTKFINAQAIDTSGFDVIGMYTMTTQFGQFVPEIHASYVLSYDLTDNVGNVSDGLGKLNRNTVGNPSPRLRGSIGMRWHNSNHSVAAFMRHVSSYENDVSGESIGSFTTFDTQYALPLDNLFGLETTSYLAVGVLNLTDEPPPFVDIAGSYDPRTGDPRGRRAYIKLNVGF